MSDKVSNGVHCGTGDGFGGKGRFFKDGAVALPVVDGDANGHFLGSPSSHEIGVDGGDLVEYCEGNENNNGGAVFCLFVSECRV